MSRVRGAGGAGWRLTLRAARAVVVFWLVVAALVALPWVLTLATRGLWQSEPDWAALVNEPLSALGIFVAGLLLGWVMWLWLLATTILDIVDAVRRPHRSGRRLPVPLHTAVTAAAGSAVLLVDAVTGRGAAVAVPPAQPLAVAADVAAPRPAAPSTPSRGQQQNAPVVSAAEAATPVAVEVSAAVDYGAAGVQVRGGWLPVPVVAAFAAVSALLWAQRRRTYQPRPPGRADRYDADLLPVDPTLAALDVLPDLDTAVPDLDGAEQRSVVIGVVGARWLDLTALPRDGVDLAGDGALNAARGLIVAILTGSVARGDAAQVVMNEGAARTLFGAVPAVPGLYLDAGISPVVAAAEKVSPGSDIGTPIVSIVTGALAGDPIATAASVRVPLRLQVTVVDGRRRSGRTAWTVDAEGVVTDALPASAARPAQLRLATLNLPTARALLSTLRQTATAMRSRTANADDRAAAPATPAATWPVTAAASTEVPWPDQPPVDAQRPRRLLIGVIGPVQVLLPRPDGTFTAVQVRRTASVHLLVLLAVHRDGITGNDLKEALWPDVPTSSARQRFATSLSELRRALQDAAGVDVVRRTAESSAGGGRYWLDPDRVQVDLWQFHDLLDAAALRTNDPAGRDQLLRDAVGLHRGDLADRLPDGPSTTWLPVHRERTARHLVDCYLHLAGLEPDPDLALQLLRRAIGLAPHTEQLYRAAMARQAATGDYDGVRRSMAALTEHLAELRTEPEPATEQLYRELLDEHVAASSAARISSRQGDHR
ncbi:BTAD domain-containing putative transcriptional regulator [Dactylosporangium cerinum]|uniref:BTAD domain-containing putative transcriptional regulator n=1 Tax=Dactylosporangium cerinum TaxID=1434730 RepID=A0ABV9VYX9_9ACTN